MPSDRLKAFFVPMARHAFGELGLGERDIVDYETGIFGGFAHADHLYRLRSKEGK